MEETWKTVPDYKDYRVSSFGKIVSDKSNGRELHPSLNKNRGYFYISMVTKGKDSRKNFILHRLVARLFIPKKEGKDYINHLDGNKSNNRVDNLEWCTCKENTQHAIKNNLIVKFKKNEGPVKYSNDQCLDVLNRVKSGLTYIKAGEKYKMPYSTVAHLVRGSRRKIQEYED